MRFYNYVYLDPRKPGKYSYPEIPISFLFEPFYIGKGTNKRMFDHLACVHSHERSLKSNKIKKIVKEGFDLKSSILKFNENISAKSALAKEIYMIATIGRISKKTGPLTNLTDGGDGGWASAYPGGESQRERNRIRMTENNPACRPEVRAKLSAAKIGKMPANLDYIHRDKNVHKKISDSLKGRKIPQGVIDRSTASKRNSVWVHQNTKTKMIQKELLEQFLNSGWVRGRA